MVKVSILGSTGVIGKNVAFTLARADTVDEIVMFARPQSVDKAKGETFDMYDALAAEDIDCKLTPTSDFDDTMIYLSLCPHCGADINSNQEFCPECMQNLDWSEYVSDTIDWR